MRPLARLRAHRVLSIVVTLAVTWIAIASAETKEYGFESKEDGGKGVRFTPAESLIVRAALDSLVGKSFTIKGGESGETTYSGTTIATDMIKMLEDGRLGKGSNAASKVNGSTQRDGRAGSVGDRVNISDHLMKGVQRQYLHSRTLSRTLAHEWLHTQQLDASEAALEAPAFQLGRSVYTGCGGQTTDSPHQGDLENETKHKKTLSGAPTNLPGSRAPSSGSHECGGNHHTLLSLHMEPGTIALTRNGVSLGSFPPLAQHVFFTVHVLATRARDPIAC